MQSPDYYRFNAERARRLSGQVTKAQISDLLLRMARDYDDIAVDLERGAIEIIHPERLPQQEHPGHR